MPQTGAVCCMALGKPCPACLQAGYPAAGAGFGLTEAGNRGMMTENEKKETQHETCSNL